MSRLTGHLRSTGQALLALTAIALVPTALEAAGIGFRNDTNQPIYVQSSITVNGQIKRGPLIYIKPGQTAWDVNLPNGNRTITIYSTANQILWQESRAFQGNDLFYAVVPLFVPRGQAARVELRNIDLKKLPMPSGK